MSNLKLKVLWLKNSLGVAINYNTPEGIVPITPYYFWPVNDAWDQLRFELDSKIWIPKNERIMLLNLSSTIMIQWRDTNVSFPDKQLKI